MKRESFLFLAKATLIALIIYNISDYLFLRKYVSQLVSGFLLHIGVRAPSSFSDGELMLGGYIFSKNCAALSVLSVIFGLLFASRGKFKEIVLSSSVIFVVVSILNIARLMVTYFLLSRNVSFFWGHDVIANGSAILLAFVLFWITDPLFPDFKKQIFDVLDDIESDARRILLWSKANL